MPLKKSKVSNAASGVNLVQSLGDEKKFCCPPNSEIWVGGARNSLRAAIFNEQNRLNKPKSVKNFVKVGLLYCCLQVNHGHWCLIWPLIFPFSLTHFLLMCQFVFTFSKYWGIIAPLSPT